jgi:hypothetical protein
MLVAAFIYDSYHTASLINSITITAYLTCCGRNNK